MFGRKKKQRYRSYGSAAYRRYYDASRVRKGKDRGGFFDQFYALSPETKKTIASIILITSSLLVLLSLMGFAGSFGQFVSHYLDVGFGFGKFYLPLLLILLGYYLARPSKYDIGALQYSGLILFILSLNGLIHIIRFHESSKQLFDAAWQGFGGGLAGWLSASPLFVAIGFFGTAIVLIAFVLISVFLLFNVSFSKIGSLFQKINEHILHLRVKKIQEIRSQDRDDNERENGRAFEERALGIDVEEAEPEDDKPDKDEHEGEKEKGSERESDLEHFSVLTSSRSRKIDMPLSLLNGKAGKPTSGDIKANQYIIKKTLENFKISVEMGDVNVGPTVTQYTLKPGEGVKLSKIVSLSDNLALALAAHPIRIEAPIPGRSLVGLEVPNQSTAIVPLKDVINSDGFRKRTSNLMLCLGQDVKGHPWLSDLGRMPHLMIAGATGSGKSVCINTLIVGLLFQNSPDDLKFILVDPKRVELPIYNNIPHLLTPVITNVKKTVNALKWAIGEMERRFEKLSEFHKRDIESYNRDIQEKMSYIIIVIDELADLMAAAGAEIEGYIIRLAQMSRAVGIHIVIATQRPSVDILTGLIKANIPSRIAFSVASLVDSRTILDTSGAEKLLGRGDMLFISTDISKPKRLQGAFATDEEIRRVVEHLKRHGAPEFLEEVTEKQTGMGEFEVDAANEKDSDPLLPEAHEVIVRAGKASASLLQRRLRVGYARAARLLDLLEARGVIGPADHAKPREVLHPRNEDDSIDEEDEKTDYEV